MSQNKSIKNSYKGMIQDISNSQFPNEYYYEGKNIRIVSTDTQSSTSITNEKGNELILSMPNIIIDVSNKKIKYLNKELNYISNEIDNLATILSTNQKLPQIIISHVNTRDYVILFTTNNIGIDCIWKFNLNNNDITLLYLRTLGFNINNPIQILNNFENEKIDKIYWVDGHYQMKFLNINHSIENGDVEELIDLPVNIVNMVGSSNINQPIISNIIKGGSHTSGKIQYAYNLYKLNSSQTKISPLSNLISLDKGSLGGGNLNESVGSIPVIDITDIDSNYTNIKVYAIKYTSYNEVPSISLINDSLIPSSKYLQIFDDGSIISNVSIEEFIFLGSNIIIPKHINSKFNRLFLSNYKEVDFNIPLDFRSYSFKNDSTCIVYNNIHLVGNNILPVDVINDVKNISNVNFTNNYEDKFNSINLDYDNYKFQSDGVTNGSEGFYLKLELAQSNIYDESSKYLKDEEIYRVAIQFYNKFGQYTNPYWINDFKSRSGNLNGNYNILKFEFKQSFYNWLNTNVFSSEYDIPVGYKILMAERTSKDKTIVANGLLSTMMLNYKSTVSENYSLTINDTKLLPKIPNILLRNCNSNSMFGNTKPLRKNLNFSSLVEVGGGPNPNNEVSSPYYGDRDSAGKFFQFNSMMQMYSPEILFNNNISLNNGLKLKIKGSLKNIYNASWSKEENLTDNTSIESKAFNGISPHFSSSTLAIQGNQYSNLDTGIIAHPGGSDPNTIETNLFYRGYGNIVITDRYSTVNIINLSNPFSSSGSGSPADNNLISFINSNKGILNKLSVSSGYHQSNIIYTINPDPIYNSDIYSVKICRDVNGLNEVIGSSVLNTTGPTFVTLPVPDNLSIFPYINYDYYLVITPLNNVFSGKVNVTSIISGSSTVNRTSLNNVFNINNSFINNNFINSNLNDSFEIYGKPEITEKGQDFTTYNNDINYRYTNSLTSCLTDGDSSYSDDGAYNRSIVSINVDNNKCATFVTGSKNNTLPNDNTINPIDRNQIEDLFNLFGNDDNNGIIAEFVIPKEEIYLGNIYGGNTYEDKKRTNYIEIGNYNDININSIIINSPGDTYVNNFRFLRIVKKDVDIRDQGYKQYEEIVEFTTETTIDLKNRNDLSKSYWDLKLSIKNEDYHKYNNVYSQQSDLLIRKNNNYNFKKAKNFDTNIISSKLKIAGEIIDSWTNLLVNEVMTLDGKYGSINSLHNFKDEIYALQDSAIAFISISPRVQIQGSDGISVQLGTGQVLERYKYLDTELGSKNKYSIINSPNSFYFYDTLNNNIQICNGQSVEELSDLKGLHPFFINNIDESFINFDNTNIDSGICTGFDYVNNQVFFTFVQENLSFTLNYDENTKTFVSFYDYLPSRYISKGNNFLTVNPNNKSKLYKQYAGEYNKFFDVYYPSYVILNVNPEYDKDCVFDNINFKSEMYLNNIDQPDKTLTHIQAYNDYQDSQLIPLTLGRNNNLRRKFRDWNALIPRQHLKRERIRAPYIKLKLQFNNTSNYKMILHPVNIFYTI